MARRFVYRKKSQNRFSMFLAILVMLLLVAAGSVRGYYLNGKLKELTDRKEQLEQALDDEAVREREIVEYGKYTETDEFVEQSARDRLGLVKDDEIIFRNDAK